MIVKDLYDKLDVPSNLRQHMLTVATLCQLLRDSWKGESVEWQDVIEAALLHDVGNVVKFDLKNFPELLGDELPRIDYWKRKQAEMVKKYGSDDHLATDKILQELGVSRSVRAIISSKSFSNARNLAKARATSSQILLYCDLRVLPSKIGSLSERLEDVRKRLKKYSSREDFPDLIKSCYEIEALIEHQLTTEIDLLLKNLDIEKIKEKLLASEVRV